MMMNDVNHSNHYDDILHQVVFPPQYDTDHDLKLSRSMYYYWMTTMQSSLSSWTLSSSSSAAAVLVEGCSVMTAVVRPTTRTTTCCRYCSGGDGDTDFSAKKNYRGK